MRLPVLHTPELGQQPTTTAAAVKLGADLLPAPNRTTLMIKPVGAMCNLRCTYCYYLPTMSLYHGRERRMDLSTLEHVFAGFLPHAGTDVTIAWQGGEPTLAGLDFFQRAFELQRRSARPGQQVRNTLQTNGTLLDDDWCRFLSEKHVLVGLSLDGPDRFHDHYRVTAGGEGSHARVLQGLDLLQKHHVEFNILCVLNRRNVHQPEELLNYFLGRGVRWLQFIPAIEWVAEPVTGEPVPAPYSPDAAAYGRFLCRLFDRWFERHRNHVSVRLFDAVLAKLVLNEMPDCVLAGSCHTQLTVEHDGSVFACDHFVEPRWRLGRVIDDDWLRQLDTARLAAFARAKGRLPRMCGACAWRRLCHGGCPKHRRHRGQAAEPTVLCAAYRRFFDYAMGRFQWLAGYLRRGEPPPPPTSLGGDAASVAAVGGKGHPPRQIGRNAPCPCGSGLKFKRCHGRRG